jgi:hypothetical protein
VCARGKDSPRLSSTRIPSAGAVGGSALAAVAGAVTGTVTLAVAGGAALGAAPVAAFGAAGGTTGGAAWFGPRRVPLTVLWGWGINGRVSRLRGCVHSGSRHDVTAAVMGHVRVPPRPRTRQDVIKACVAAIHGNTRSASSLSGNTPAVVAASKQTRAARTSTRGTIVALWSFACNVSVHERNNSRFVVFFLQKARVTRLMPRLAEAAVM